MTNSNETPEQKNTGEGKSWLDEVIEAEDKFGCSAGRISEAELSETRRLVEMQNLQSSSDEEVKKG